MANAQLSRRIGKVVVYPPLSEMSDIQRREFHEALLGTEPLRICPANGRRRS
jgi:hypothetical protein